MSDFTDFVGAELPLRIVLIKGATDATGDPNSSALVKVQLAPEGTMYLQNDTTPKVLWKKDGGTASDWEQVMDPALLTAINTAITNLGTEVDLIEVALGLDTDGTWIAFAGTNYLDASVGLTTALSALDTQAKVNADAIATEITDRDTAIGVETSRATTAEDTIEAGAGLEADGTYLANGTTNYIGTATSLKDADEKLDTQIKTTSDAVAQEVIDRGTAITSAVSQEVIDRDAAILVETNRAIAEEALKATNADVGSKANLFTYGQGGFTYTGSNLMNAAGTTSMRNATDTGDVTPYNGLVTAFADGTTAAMVTWNTGNNNGLMYKVLDTLPATLGKFTITIGTAQSGNTNLRKFEIIGRTALGAIETIVPTAGSTSNTNTVTFEAGANGNSIVALGSDCINSEVITIETGNATQYAAYGYRMVQGGALGYSNIAEFEGIEIVDTNSLINVVDAVNDVNTKVDLIGAPDDVTVEKDNGTESLQVKDAGITLAKLAPEVLTTLGTPAVDDTTIELFDNAGTDTLRVKDGGIDWAKLALSLQNRITAMETALIATPVYDFAANASWGANPEDTNTSVGADNSWTDGVVEYNLEVGTDSAWGELP